MTAELERIDLGRRETVAAEITRRLLSYLLAGSIKPGERIPSERKLAEALGVGRSVVREALKSLTLLGLVDVRQGNGTFLKRTGSDLLPEAIEWGLLLGVKRSIDLVEARQYIEEIVAALAAERRTEANLESLRELVRRMRSGLDADDYLAADVAFHLGVAEAAGNLALIQIMSSIRSLLHAWVRRAVNAERDIHPSADEHLAILDAIERRDPQAAREAMAVHMARATTRLRMTLTEASDDADPAAAGAAPAAD
jgi:GntR family transcriptional regulator, transcriptional repressor for pyruvate dehydrogenase complex